MTLRHLEIFRSVCQAESITLAAEHLNMTQPAVSQAIRELESFYRTKLFERMNRRIYITESGRTLLQYTDTILSQFQDSIHALQEIQHSGNCRFGVHVTFGETCMPIILKRLSEELPDITAKAFVGNSRKNEEMLLRNELDFAVIDNVKLSPGLTVLPLCRERMAVVCRPDYLVKNQITLKELSKEHLLLREEGSGTRDSIEGVFHAAGERTSIYLDSSSTSALLACAKAGLGITILASSLIEHSIRKGELKELEVTDGSFFRQYYLAYHKNKYLTESIKQVIQVVCGCCKMDSTAAYDSFIYPDSVQ